MDSPPSTKSSPSKALNPLSPERMNQQAVPNSPSAVSEVLRLQRKGRGLSDVQSKVAFLNGLSRSGSPGLSGGTSTGGGAALQRAILGREEAETALSRVSSQLSEAQSRERRISERLESLLEELQTAKERQAHERVVFEKEIRKARKEAFRAGSTLVKVQEELKHAKSESKAFKEEVQAERDSKEKAKQEAFERAYAIAGLTEELEELKGRLRTAESKLQAQEQEINRQKIEKISLTETGSIATQTSAPRGFKRPADEIATSPRKSSDRMSLDDTPSKKLRLCDPPPHREGRQYGYGIFPPALTIQELIDNLEDELMYERNKRIDLEDQIEFMRVCCMFKACTCRHNEYLENKAREEKAAKAAQKNLEETQEVEEEERETCDVSSTAGASQQEKQTTTEIEAQVETQSGEAMDVDDEVEHFQKNTQEEAQREVQDEDFPEEVQIPEQEVVQQNIQEHILDTVQEDIQEVLQENVQEDTHEEFEEETEEPEEEEPQETTITFSPVTGTFHTIPSPTRSSPLKQTQDVGFYDHAAKTEIGLKARPELASPTPKYDSHPRAMPYDTLHQSEAYSRDLTAGAHHSSMTAEARWQHENSNGDDVEIENVDLNVQRIPLRAEDEASNSFAPVPGTPISREQALAQIRARRGRTSAMKRSVSANDAGFRAGGLNITPVRAARRIPGVVQQSDPRGDGVKKSRRDMSAPMRMFR
ncbi:hypothetical protein BJY01DRAFT_225137 [Aspergillus pseudoustus]|uniref:Uncharacterized protein n=1 Tax=Aspergillus pseudoustus TaxID=1810923 RepID=A0ABR4J0H3_9EURO